MKFLRNPLVPSAQNDVRFGSVADISEELGMSALPLKSGHTQSRHQCLLSANSRRGAASKPRLVVKRASLGHDRFNKAGPFVHQSPLQFPREGLGSIDGNGRHAKSFADLHPV